MLSITSAPRRRLAAGVAGVLLAGAASSVVVAPAVQAAPSGGTLTWNVSQQYVASFPDRVLSDGVTFDQAAGTFAFPVSDVTKAADGTVTTSMRGTVAATAPVTRGGYTVTISNPVLKVEADGDGEIRATVSSKVPNTDPVSTPPTLVTVAQFSGAATAGATTTAVPNWAGVLTPGSPEAVALGITDPARPVDGKSFHPEFLGAIHADVRPHFYFTSTGEAKRPGNISLTTAALVPTVTPTVTSVDPATGVSVKVEGKEFTAVTNPGDAGVYAALAPADTVINYADRKSLDALAAVDYITPARFTGTSFTTVLTAPTAKLEKGKQYAVFTWQAHTHSNTSQDTKTPVTIDWSKLEAPVVVKADSTTKVKIAKKPTRKKAGKAVVTVKGGTAAATGTVVVKIKVAGVKKAKKVTVTLDAKGKANIKLPKAKKKGAYKVVVTYAGDDKLNAAKKTVKKFKVKK